MDGEYFDHVVRTLAHEMTRRKAVFTLLAAVVGFATTGVDRRAEAKPNCGGHSCGHACCKGKCCLDAADVCTDAGKCCPAIQTCGVHCCPPENVGCTEVVLPNGDVKIGCLCPEGKYLARGKCLAGHKDHNTCKSDEQCCSSACCNGYCCPDGQFCNDGKCTCESDQLTCGDVCCPKDHVCQDGKCACKKDQLNCGSTCVPKEVQGIEGGVWPGCCTADDCPTKAVCHDHACLECGPGTGLHCPAGQTCCTGHCKKLAADKCGCFGPCDSGWTCEPGSSPDAPGTCCTKDGDSTICKGHPGT